MYCHQNLFIVLLSVSMVISMTECLPSFQTFVVGDFNGTVITDGSYTLCSNPYVLPDRLYRKKLQAERRSFLPGRLAINIVVVDIFGKRVMVDTGSYIPPSLRGPSSQDGGLLFQGMQMAGITPESIDAVILTHGHQDHVRGLVTADGTPAFPNAFVYVSETEHNFWTTPSKYLNADIDVATSEGEAKVYQSSVSKYPGRLKLVKAGSLFAGVHLLSVPGHSPGHMVIKFGGKRHLYVTGDAWVLQAFQVKNPGLEFAFDANRTQAVSERFKLLCHLEKSRDLVLSYHETFPGLGYIGKRFRWIVAPYEELQPDTSSTCV